MRNKFEKLYDALFDVYGHSNEMFRLAQIVLVCLSWTLLFYLLHH